MVHLRDSTFGIDYHTPAVYRKGLDSCIPLKHKVNMNRLSQSERTAVVRCLVEGNSIRSTVRMTGVAKNSISKLLVELGAACSKFMDEAMRNLTSAVAGR